MRIVCNNCGSSRSWVKLESLKKPHKARNYVQIVAVQDRSECHFFIGFKELHTARHSGHFPKSEFQSDAATDLKCR